MINRYNSISAVLRDRFGERVYKVTLEAGLGCPNRDGTKGLSGCSFCHPGALRPSTSRDDVPIKAIADQLEEGIGYIRARHGASRFVSYLQSGSNTFAPVGRLARIFEEAISHPAVVGLAVSTRPDCVESEHVELLSELSRRTMVWVELGLQSAHDETLAKIGRGHTVSEFARAAEELARAGVPVCAHVILGLPGETHDMMMETADYLNRVAVWGVKIHNLHVLEGTRLHEEYRDGALELPTLEEYASLVVDFMERLSPDIVIHRFNGHSPRRFTVAPKWSVNKLATLNAVHAELVSRDSRQAMHLSD